MFLTPSVSLCDRPGVPPVAVPQRVGRVWQSSAALSLGAAGSRPGITAVGAGLLTHRTPGQTSSLLTIPSVSLSLIIPHTQTKHNTKCTSA